MTDLGEELKDAILRLGKEVDEENNAAKEAYAKDVEQLAIEWHKDDVKERGQSGVPGKRGFQVTTNTSRETFNCVKEHPGMRQAQIAQMMERRGFKESSVRTLLVQMTKCGLLRRTAEGKYYPNKPAYEPIKPSVLQKAREKGKKHGAAQGAHAGGLMTLTNEGKVTSLDLTNHTPPPSPGITINNSLSADNPDAIIAKLSFTQAIALYKKLKSMLGEL